MVAHWRENEQVRAAKIPSAAAKGTTCHPPDIYLPWSGFTFA